MNNLKETLGKIGIQNAYINHSNGGLMSIAESMQFPIKTGLSGPAAGVVGAQYITALIGEEDLITIDIGGTSTDISLVAGGRFEASDEKPSAVIRCGFLLLIFLPLALAAAASDGLTAVRS